jgi:signal transduction histidine kinase
MGALKRSQCLRTGFILIYLVGVAYGLDPNRQISQYIRQRWSTESEFPSGPVHAISQTPDGYLWIGTDKGLVRFDGFNFLPVPLTSNIGDPNTPVLGLVPDAEGNLLIQPQGLGMLRYKKGQFESVETGLIASVSQVTAMWREQDGGVVFSDLIAGTLRLRNGKIEQLVPDALAGTAPVMALTEASNGRVWLGTLNSGLFSVYQGKIAKVSSQLPNTKINCLLPVGDDEVWLGTDSGAFHWDGVTFVPIPLPTPFNKTQVLSLLRDRDFNVWIGTAQGLLRMNGKTISRWDEGQFPSGAINALFEDREGNIWVGGTRGLERIRDSAFLTYSSAVGLPSDYSGPVYVDTQNRTWFAPIEGGLYLLSEGKAQAIKVAGLNSDVVYSIAGGSNDTVWIGRQRGGITRLRFANGTVRDQTYTQADGLVQNSVYSVYQARDGTVWAGTLSGGVSELKDERFVTYTTANGLGSNTVASILEAQDGAMWFATSNGLSTLSNGQWKTYAKADGLPSEDVNCLYQNSSGVLWIGTSGGLALFNSGHIQVPHTAPASLREEIFGIKEDNYEWLWVATAKHVLRVRSAKLLSDTIEVEDVREYGQADGLLSLEGVKRNASLVTDSSGKIWFSLSRGLSVVDPAQITKRSVPALAHIEAVLADGKTIHLGDEVRIPPSQKRVVVNFTGLSLAVPEHVRFRYMLDGFDRGWSDPVAAREAVYTNLSPGSYRFRLVASNSEGEWNGAESSMVFAVDPAFWQTWWFRVLCLAVVGLLVFVLYQLHLHKVTRQLNVRFEERLAERTRIAQELHDTLLQGVVSASMQLHVANDQIDVEAPSKPLVTRVLELMGGVVEDGRNAVRGLRVSSEGTRDLDLAFSRVPADLAVQGTAGFRVVVEGPVRDLHPVIRDEVYRIGREAVANAFRHSGAKSIEVALEYGIHELRVVVRDDGRGIGSEILHSGREGHWGLSGMRERAEKIGAKLKVWSTPENGTEVELRIPGRIAFESHSSSSVSKWLSKITRQKSDGIGTGKGGGVDG